MNTLSTSGRLGALRRCASLVSLALCVIAWTATPAFAAEEAPEPMLTRLEFRVLDAGPDALPVRQFRYSFSIHSAAEEEVVRQSDVACHAEDGVFRIPEPFPLFGRIRVWIEGETTWMEHVVLEEHAR